MLFSALLADDVVVSGRQLSIPIVLVGVVVVTVLFTRISGLLIRWMVRRVAHRSMVQSSRWWRARVLRTGGETIEMDEQRRRQRNDAAARMLNHVVSLMAWIGAGIAVFHVLDIDAAFFLSSAGFLGAGIAIGGQHKVNDYLTGMSVLLEDRYGVGDEVVVEIGWSQPVRGIVDQVGLVTTRLRTERGTVHLSNSSLGNLRNLSQEATATTLSVKLPDTVLGAEPDDDAISRAVEEAVRQFGGSRNLTDVFFVGDIEAHGRDGDEVRVDVRTTRPLDDDARSLLVQRTERALERDG